MGKQVLVAHMACQEQLRDDSCGKEGALSVDEASECDSNRVKLIDRCMNLCHSICRLSQQGGE